MGGISSLRAWLVTLACIAGLPAHGADLVLVAGATGGTGREVVAQLVAAGYPVRALVRDPDAARGTLGDGPGYVRGDVRDRASLDAAMQGVRFVIVTIGATRKDPANGPEFVDYQGVRNLAEAAAAARVDQLVLVSSSGVTREDHQLNRMFDNVLIWKGKGEEAVRQSGVAYTIIRPGGLTNKPGGETGLRFEQGDQGTGIVTRADVARVCIAALKSPAARSRTFELFSGEGGPDIDWDAAFGKLAADGGKP